MKYKDAGVHLEEASKAIEAIKMLLSKHQPKHAQNIGKFAGGYPLKKITAGHQVLSASVDGVGTKTKLAAITNTYEVIGYDIVAHCVNDLMVQGGTPLFFMDYIAMGSLSVPVIEKLFTGMLKCANECNVAIIGGETAEMPGIYQKDDFDLVGFIVGIYNSKKSLPKRLKIKDKIIGINSSGLHTNGFSLIRKIIKKQNLSLMTHYQKLSSTLADALMKSHSCYYKVLRQLINANKIKAAAHITGGGIQGNLNRVLTPNIDAIINKNSWRSLPIFDFIRQEGNVPDDDMYTTFNMGLGMILVVSEIDVSECMKLIKKAHFSPYLIGEIKKGTGEVILE